MLSANEDYHSWRHQIVILKTRNLNLKDVCEIKEIYPNEAECAGFILGIYKPKCKHLMKEVESIYKNYF